MPGSLADCRRDSGIPASEGDSDPCVLRCRNEPVACGRRRSAFSCSRRHSRGPIASGSLRASPRRIAATMEGCHECVWRNPARRGRSVGSNPDCGTTFKVVQRSAARASREPLWGTRPQAAGLNPSPIPERHRADTARLESHARHGPARSGWCPYIFSGSPPTITASVSREVASPQAVEGVGDGWSKKALFFNPGLAGPGPPE